MEIEQTYPVAYKLIDYHEHPVTAEQLKAEHLGGADAVIFFSLIYPPDGSRSEIIGSLDGRTGEVIDDGELFKSFLSLANILSGSRTLGEGRRQFAAKVFESARKAILTARDAKKELIG